MEETAFGDSESVWKGVVGQTSSVDPEQLRRAEECEVEEEAVDLRWQNQTTKASHFHSPPFSQETTSSQET